MRCLLLAAGYGTRLAADIEADKSGKFDHLKGIPKPLLPVASTPLSTIWIDAAREAGLNRVDVITNHLYCHLFENWANAISTSDLKINVIDDGTVSNETRLGAVADLQLVVEREHIADDLVIVAGDTLFFKDFSLSKVIERFRQLPTDTSLLLAYKCGEDVSKRGILEVDSDMHVTSFLEKPQPHETTSRLAAPCFYVLCKAHVPLLKTFLTEMADQPLSARDAPGNFIRWLVSRANCTAETISGRFDVGNLQQYEECDVHFKAQQ